jgi:poly-D-alanine transfer protein DltD
MFDLKKVLEEAKKDFAANMNWMDFNNKYFRPGSEYMPKELRLRREYLASPEYNTIQDMKFALEEKQPEVVRPEETFSGEFRVRVSPEIHKMLIEEVREHDLKSLNELCKAKLETPYCDIIKLRDRK